jgi:hypothetical protein
LGLFAVSTIQTLTLVYVLEKKNDALAHFVEIFQMRHMARCMITALRHSSAECAYGACRGLFLCPGVWRIYSYPDPEKKIFKLTHPIFVIISPLKRTWPFI